LIESGAIYSYLKIINETVKKKVSEIFIFAVKFIFVAIDYIQQNLIYKRSSK